MDRQYPSASFIPIEKQGRPTEICSILQPRISDKTNSRMESLGIPQCIHDHPRILAPQLRLYALQHPLEAQPEADLLRCRGGGNVPRELGHHLDGIDLCEWRESRNVLSVRGFDGMWEMSSRWPCDWAFIQFSETSSSQEGRIH